MNEERFLRSFVRVPMVLTLSGIEECYGGWSDSIAHSIADSKFFLISLDGDMPIHLNQVIHQPDVFVCVTCTSIQVFVYPAFAHTPHSIGSTISAQFASTWRLTHRLPQAIMDFCSWYLHSPLASYSEQLLSLFLWSHIKHASFLHICQDWETHLLFVKALWQRHLMNRGNTINMVYRCLSYLTVVWLPCCIIYWKKLGGKHIFGLPLMHFNWGIIHNKNALYIFFLYINDAFSTNEK